MELVVVTFRLPKSAIGRIEKLAEERSLAPRTYLRVLVMDALELVEKEKKRGADAGKASTPVQKHARKPLRSTNER